MYIGERQGQGVRGILGTRRLIQSQLDRDHARHLLLAGPTMAHQGALGHRGRVLHHLRGARGGTGQHDPPSLADAQRRAWTIIVGKNAAVVCTSSQWRLEYQFAPNSLG